jgi:hypothetical protein
MPDYMLTFELNEDKDEILIHGDEKGLRSLIENLERLLASTEDGHFNHEHLKTPEWGGDELSSESQSGTVLNHVKIHCWKGSGESVGAA